MKWIGAHVSTKGGIENAPLNANKIGAKAFGLFLKNQLQWKASPLKEETILKFKRNCENFNYTPEQILPHSSYLINLCSPEKDKLKKSRDAFIDEMKRAELLGLRYLNFHPGSHRGKMSEKECIKLVAESINIALSKVDNVIVVIENTAGQGGNIGFRFEHLREIIDNVHEKDKIGVCLDTAHLHGAGYKLSDFNSFVKTMEEFKEIVGERYLKAFHLNDSKVDLGTQKDRHESLGLGKIGIKAFEFLIRDPVSDNKPLILETVDQKRWPEEIKLLYSFYFNNQ